MRLSRDGLTKVFGVALVAFASCQSGGSPTSRSETVEKPVFVRGPSGGAPIAPFMKKEMERARPKSRDVLVYVGAKWCEPCQHFHQAVESGRLDETLAGMRFVEFDLDVDRDALDQAGYGSKMIPLFAVPGVDGRASPKRFEGSVKGVTAVDQNIVPRLERMLGRRSN